MVPRTISCISVGTSLHPSRRMPYNTPLPLPPPTPPRKKHKHRNKNQTFSTIYSRSFVLGKERFQRKRLLLACIAGVSAGCANVFFSDNVFILLQLNSCLTYQHSCTACWCVAKWPFNRLSTSSLTGTITLALYFFPEVFSFLVQNLTHGLFTFQIFSSQSGFTN